MILSAKGSKLTKDSDSDLLSLLMRSLPSFNVPSASRSNEDSLPSFEDPFDDPTMEPLPLKIQEPQTHNSPLIRSKSDSETFTTREDWLSSSFMEPNLAADDTNLRQNRMIDLSDSIIYSVGSKRSPEAMLSDHRCDRLCSTTTKRQRICPKQGGDPHEESTARFRPYQEKQWRAQFQKLLQYKLEHGSCCVPHSHREDPALARWVKRQRYQYKKFNDGDPTSTMTTRRIQELESVGFVWHSHASAWQEKLNELKDFQRLTGHCNVPSKYPQNVSLSTWVKCQRRQYKLFVAGAVSSMTLERFRVLKSMGFVFDLQQQRLGYRKFEDLSVDNQDKFF